MLFIVSSFHIVPHVVSLLKLEYDKETEGN